MVLFSFPVPSVSRFLLMFLSNKTKEMVRIIHRFRFRESEHFSKISKPSFWRFLKNGSSQDISMYRFHK